MVANAYFQCVFADCPRLNDRKLEFLPIKKEVVESAFQETAAINACAQDNEKTLEKPGNTNASFDIRFPILSVGAVLLIHFRDTENGSFLKRTIVDGVSLSTVWEPPTG